MLSSFCYFIYIGVHFEVHSLSFSCKYSNSLFGLAHAISSLLESTVSVIILETLLDHTGFAVCTSHGRPLIDHGNNHHIFHVYRSYYLHSSGRFRIIIDWSILTPSTVYYSGVISTIAPCFLGRLGDSNKYLPSTHTSSKTSAYARSLASLISALLPSA